MEVLEVETAASVIVGLWETRVDRSTTRIPRPVKRLTSSSSRSIKAASGFLIESLSDSIEDIFLASRKSVGLTKRREYQQERGE